MLMLRNPLFRSEFDELVDTIWNGKTRFDGAHGMRWLSERQRPTSTWQELDDRMVLELSVPGLKAEELDVELTGRQLRVRAERTIEVPEGYTAIRRERSAWKLDRAWTLPDSVDPEQLTARVEDGVLVLQLPKRPEQKPRRIAIAGGPVAQIEQKEVS